MGCNRKLTHEAARADLVRLTTDPSIPVSNQRYTMDQALLFNEGIYLVAASRIPPRGPRPVLANAAKHHTVFIRHRQLPPSSVATMSA